MATQQVRPGQLKLMTPFFDHIESGCVWTADAAGSTRVASMTAGVAWIGGNRVVVAAVSSRTFTASRDVYVGLTDAGNGTATIVYYDNTTNAASPSLATAGYTMIVGIIVVGASNIASAASINQGQEDKILPIASSIPYAVTDSLGNLICPRDPSRSTLGYRQVLATVGPLSTSTTDVDINVLSVPVIVPTGRKIKITVHGGGYSQTGGIDTIYGVIRIKESTTRLSNNATTPSAANLPAGFDFSASLTPSAGLHTYKMSVNNNSTGPNFSLGAASDDPMYIRVELT